MCKRLRVELPSAAAATLLISAIKMTSSGVRRGGNQDTFILPGRRALGDNGGKGRHLFLWEADGCVRRAGGIIAITGKRN